MGIRDRVIRDKGIVGIMIRGIMTVGIMIVAIMMGVMGMEGTIRRTGMGALETLGVQVLVKAKDKSGNAVVMTVQELDLSEVLLGCLGRTMGCGSESS